MMGHECVNKASSMCPRLTAVFDSNPSLLLVPLLRSNCYSNSKIDVVFNFRIFQNHCVSVLGCTYDMMRA